MNTSARNEWISASSSVVAEIICVTESSIWNWEHGTEPELQYNPRIIEFLGYIPFDCPDDTVGRLAWYNTNSISRPYLRWLVFGCSTYAQVRLAASILAALISSLIWNWNKRVMGMNLDLLGEAMNRDPEQLSDWLNGRHYPFKKNRDKIELLLELQEMFSS